MNNEKLLINDNKSNNSEFKSNKRIEEMAKVIKSSLDNLESGNHHFTGEEISTMFAEALYNEDYRKQGEGEWETLTKAHIQAHYEAISALADMVNQFGYSTTFRNQKAVCDGGLSALEYAFGALEDCGCKLNSNGTITLKNLFAFQEEIDAKMKGE